MDCPFAQEAWKFTLNGLNVTAPSQTTVTTLYSSWKARYSHKMQSKSIWQAIPKYLCWKIWLGRNDQIYNSVLHSPLTVAIKAKALLLEAMTYHPVKDEKSLLPEEKNWLGAVIPEEKKKIIARPQSTPSWRLRETNAVFQDWWRKQGKETFFSMAPPKETQGKQGQVE